MMPLLGLPPKPRPRPHYSSPSTLEQQHVTAMGDTAPTLQNIVANVTTISALNVVIAALSPARKISSIAPAKAVSGSVCITFVTIRVSPFLSLFG